MTACYLWQQHLVSDDLIKPIADQSSHTSSQAILPHISLPTTLPFRVFWLVHTTTIPPIPVLLKLAGLFLIFCCLLFFLPWPTTVPGVWFPNKAFLLPTDALLLWFHSAFTCRIHEWGQEARGNGPMETQVAVRLLVQLNLWNFFKKSRVSAFQLRPEVSSQWVFLSDSGQKHNRD